MFRRGSKDNAISEPQFLNSEVARKPGFMSVHVSINAKMALPRSLEKCCRGPLHTYLLFVDSEMCQ